MKKLFTLLLAGLMVFSMASCAGDNTDADSTDGSNAAATTTKANTTTAQKTVTTPDVIDQKDDPETPDDWTLMSLKTDWHYKLFNCPTLYSSVDEGVAYDPELDEMAAWLTEKGDEWYKDETVLTEMAGWNVNTAPMGDRYDGLGDGNSPIGWSGDVHGIICYTTFELTEEQMGWVAAAEINDIYMDMWYDNTIYIWINGTLVYSHDGEGAPQNQGGDDWNDALEPVDFMEGVDIRDILQAGENNIVVSLKDGWGGREFIMALECVY
ncbi:MAG: hypothetical protein IJX47_04000 [Clostridia bacterium]|nr:hypothetical protein [Clostridia bacterium]